MEKPEFRQENVDSHIKEIMAMPDEQRKEVADNLRKAGLKGYLTESFTLDKAYEEIIAQFDESFADEMTYSIALAFEKSHWNLVVKMPEQPTAVRRCKDTTQEVSGSYSSGSGYTVTKTVGWTWG